MMNRRKLIAGAAGLATGSALTSTTRALGTLSSAYSDAPALTLSGRKGELEVAFNSMSCLPRTYDYRGGKLLGMLGDQPVRAIVCRLQPREYQAVPIRKVAAQQTSKIGTFAFSADYDGSLAVEFHLKFSIDAASLVLTLESVKEHAGFQLIEIALPELVTVREEDGAGWMAEGRHGGSFVTLEDARAFRFPDNEYFGRVSTELPVGMVGQSGIGCVMEVTAFMDGTETEIQGAPGHRRAILGTVLTHRVHGGRCYNMNDGDLPVCGNAHTPNLIVEQSPRTRFDFFESNGAAQPWLAGAKILRARAPGSPSGFFSDRLLYIVAGKKKIEAEPRTTFAQSGELVRDVALLTDHAPQTVFISGWVYDGQDTGFPSEDKINRSLGSYEELRGLIEGGKRWNANITLNTNYDDAYKSSPIFNDDFIARRPDGAIWKSRDWDGESSYVVGMAKFMEGGWGRRRIDYTMARYRISESILIDAMSWFAVRNDWDPRKPASGYKNLIDGKYKIIEQFRDRGVAVTSEQLRYPFVGRLAVSMDGPGTSSCPFGGEAIPLVATVYRGAAIWGTTGGRLNKPQQQLFWNTRSSLWFQADSDRMTIAEFYYLVVLPYSKLHRLEVEGYESSGPMRKITLAQRSQVMMDTTGESYAVQVNGVEIAKDDATFCPIDEHRIAFYTRTARELRHPVPNGWDPSRITARALSLHGRTKATVRSIAGMIEVDAEARQPVIVYSDESAIPVA